jgi:hypothetical protein
VVITYLSLTLPITGNVSGITGGTNTISSLTLPARSCRGTPSDRSRDRPGALW